MLYWLAELSDGGDMFNLFRYITFRAGGAFFTALIFGFIFGKPLINLLRRKQGKGQPIRVDGPPSHLIEKAGTPTMGGVLILGAVVFSSVLWARPDNPFVWMLEVDGMIIDARTAPLEFQQEAYRLGLIPYIPGENLPQEPEPQSDAGARIIEFPAGRNKAPKQKTAQKAQDEGPNLFEEYEK